MLDPLSQETIERYLRAVLDANKTVNLTTITGWDEALVLHIEDSLAGLPEVDAAPEGALLDMGTGGGFPGVPLAVATGRPVVLADAREKKIKAVMDAVAAAGIEGVTGHAGRVENLAQAHPGEFSVVVARALASLPVLLELAYPLLRAGGELIAYKSGDCEGELAAALSLEDKLAMTLRSDRALTLSDGSARRIIVFERTGEAKVDLPRRPGMAQKRPYA